MKQARASPPSFHASPTFRPEPSSPSLGSYHLNGLQVRSWQTLIGEWLQGMPDYSEKKMRSNTFYTILLIVVVVKWKAR